MNDIANIKNIAIIGAGTMGYEIAQVALMGGFETVMLNDLKKEIIEKASRKIENGLYKLEAKGKLNPDVTVPTLMENLVCTVNLKEAVSSADFIIEAIPEVMKLKQELFKKLGKFSSKGTILATNTSTMSITDIASPSGRADKVIGCHFLRP